MMKIHHTKEKGFTLVEVIVVMVLIGIVTLLAVPNIKDFLKNSTTRSVARELYSNFQRAKLEAVKRNQNVAIVFTTTGTHQYQIYIDADADGTLDGGEQVLATTVLPAQNNLNNSTFASNCAGFDSRGRPYWPAPWPVADPKVEVVNTSTAKKFTLTASLAGSVHLD